MSQPPSYKLLCNQASNHPSLSRDCSLSQHLRKVLWATGPGVRNGANLLYEYPLDPKPDRPSLEGWVFARRWAAWPRLSEVAAFSQHKLDGWHRASNPASPSRGYFHDCWLGLVSHLSVAPTTSHCDPTAGQRQSAMREGWENHPWPKGEAKGQSQRAYLKGQVVWKLDWWNSRGERPPRVEAACVWPPKRPSRS